MQCSLGMGLATDAFANKAAVTIEAPESAAPVNGHVKVTVTHNGNNMFHHMGKLGLYHGEREKRPAAGTSDGCLCRKGVPFTREIQYKVTGPLEIKAEANCNIHGSKGPAAKTISVR